MKEGAIGPSIRTFANPGTARVSPPSPEFFPSPAVFRFHEASDTTHLSESRSCRIALRVAVFGHTPTHARFLYPAFPDPRGTHRLLAIFSSQAWSFVPDCMSGAGRGLFHRGAARADCG
jgi:hypothetical protein